MLQVLSEQKKNMKQLSLQCDELVSQNQQLVQVIGNACRSVPELAILENIPTEARIHRLVVGVREVREKMIKVQLEMDLQIIELQLNMQLSTPLEVRE